jgi:hypothetical protein
MSCENKQNNLINKLRVNFLNYMHCFNKLRVNFLNHMLFCINWLIWLIIPIVILIIFRYIPMPDKLRTIDYAQITCSVIALLLSLWNVLFNLLKEWSLERLQLQVFKKEIEELSKLYMEYYDYSEQLMYGVRDDSDVDDEAIRAYLKESEQEMHICFTRIHSKSTSSNKINILKDLVKDLEVMHSHSADRIIARSNNPAFYYPGDFFPPDIIDAQFTDAGKILENYSFAMDASMKRAIKPLLDYFCKKSEIQNNDLTGVAVDFPEFDDV